MYLKCFIILAALTSQAQAAPYPATSTSMLTNPEKGLYLSHKGFTVKTTGQSWVPANDETEGTHGSAVRFASPVGLNDAYLSIRTDKVIKSASLDLYSRKWLKEYHNYGFEVLSSKQFNLNNQTALLVDLLSRSKGKQLRQVVIKNEDKVAVMTCVDDRDRFDDSVKKCNEIIKTFSWVGDTAPVMLKK